VQYDGSLSVYTMHAHTLNPLLPREPPNPFLSPNRLYAMRAPLTLTHCGGGREAEQLPGAFVDFAGLPLSIQEAQTAEEAARFMNTKKREMYNVVAVQLRRHALTAAASLARDSLLLRPEAFLRRSNKDRQVAPASSLPRHPPAALPHATPCDTRAHTL
jgi:hypothetical protein